VTGRVRSTTAIPVTDEVAHRAARERRTEPEPPAHELLALQRRLGNQAVQRLLSAGGTLARKGPPAPTRTPIAPVANLYGGTSADQWEQHLNDGGGVKELYSEIATLLNATVIEDVAGTGPEHINGALRVAADELKPGLNFVSRMQTPGKCGYLHDGLFDAKLPAVRDGPLPTVAILLGPGAFVAGNKARTLAVLRHELEHAAHNRMAIAWLKRWRADGKAAGQTFRAWLGTQSIAAADLALIRERLDNTDVNTEALAHLEGYIAGFPHETAAAAKTSRSVYGELHEAAEHWRNSDPAVQQEFSARLREFKARLKGERLTAFAADLRRLKAENEKLAALVDPLLP
jgi:hypothetical protein